MEHTPGLIFRFCPKCASENMRRTESHAQHCADCGFLFYLNSSAAVAVFIEDDDGRILLTRRAKEPGKGMWDLPGGFVDPGETAENAVKREIKEELNLEVTGSTYRDSVSGNYCYAGITYAIINLVFICRVKHFAGMRAGDDVSEIRFFKKDEIDPDQIGLESIKSILFSLLGERNV
jgi:NAD+ diphosphatase